MDVDASMAGETGVNLGQTDQTDEGKENGDVVEEIETMSLQVESERTGEAEQVDGDEGAVGQHAGQVEHGHGHQLQDHATMLLKGHRLSHPVLLLPENANEEKEVQHGDEDAGNDVVQVLVDEGQVTRRRVVAEFTADDEIVVKGVDTPMGEDGAEVEGEDVGGKDEQGVETKAFDLSSVGLVAMGEDEEIPLDGDPTHEERDQSVEGQVDEVPQLTEEIVGEEHAARPQVEENQRHVEETSENADHQQGHDQVVRVFLSVVARRLELVEKIGRAEQRQDIEHGQRVELEQTNHLFGLRRQREEFFSRIQ